MQLDIKIIVYSLDINGYDEIINPLIHDKNVRYILFSDDKTRTSKFWEVVHIDPIEGLDHRKLARYYKINSHLVLPEHDISMYVDSCTTPNFLNFKNLLQDNGFDNCDIMCYNHTTRKCLYDESQVVISGRLDYSNIVNDQINNYRLDGFPENFGLSETGIIIRKNNERITEFNSTWWNQVNTHSGRDQLSQMYSSWKTGVNICNFKKGKSQYDNPYTTKFRHHKKKWVVD